MSDNHLSTYFLYKNRFHKVDCLKQVMWCLIFIIHTMMGYNQKSLYFCFATPPNFSSGISLSATRWKCGQFFGFSALSQAPTVSISDVCSFHSVIKSVHSHVLIIPSSFKITVSSSTSAEVLCRWESG